MPTVAAPGVEPSAEAERIDTVARTAPEPAVGRKLGEATFPPPSAAALDVPDPAVQAATRELVRILAPLLGLDAGRITVAHGPGPAAARDVVRLSAAAAPERSTVVHELAHVAQHRNRARPRAAADTTRAEAEASALEAAARAGAPLWAPRAVLPEGRTARQADASGIAATEPPATVDSLAAELDRLVQITRAAELRRISEAGSAAFATTADQIDGLLQVLQTLDFVTARAVVHALDSEERIRLAHLTDSLHRRYPGACAALLAGLRRGDIEAFGQREPANLRDALHGIAAEQLAGTQLRGLLDSMRFVPQSILIELERSDRRDAFRKLLGDPAPSGNELEELKTAVSREKTAEHAATDKLAGATVERLKALITGADAESAHTALDVLTPFAEATLPPPPSAGPAIPGVPDTPASEAAPAPELPKKEGTNAPPTPTELLRAIVAALDAQGLVNQILDGLPEESRYEGRRSATLKLVLAARAPGLTLPRIESLLSYGVFDWAIKDAEARWAYLLVRSLPLQIQDAWRLLDEGKWFQRLEDNMPEELVTSGEYTGVGSEYRMGTHELTAEEAKAAQERFDSMRRLWSEHSDAPTAKWIARLLLGIDPETMHPMVGAEKDLNVRIGAVRRLDTSGTLHEIYRAFPEEYLLGETGRREILELTYMRDPVHVEQSAAKLLGTGLFDWWISSREAWIAYQLLRTLPEAAQQRFKAADPGRWSSMLSAMTAEMRASLATGAATGRGPFPGREALRARLRDPKLWTAKHALELRALMDLARATDDAEFVFNESRARKAYLIAGLEKLVADLQLYDPRAHRETFKGEELRERVGFVEFLRFVDELSGISWILVGIGAWLIMDWISIGGKSIEVKDFDLSWAQWAAGGDLAGARLAERPAEPIPTPSAGKEGAPAAPAIGPNRLSLEADLGTGAVRLRLPELALKSLNIVRAGSSYRTGPLTLRNLRVQGDFSDRHYREPVGVELDADRLDVDDMVLADPSLPSGAWALAHLLTRPIHLKAGAKGDEDLSAHPPREGAIPIPIFGPILEALSNIVALKGAIPFDYTLVDFALLPATSGMSVFASTPIGLAANAAVKTPAPVDYLWGLATDGTLRPPRSAADRAKDAIAMLKSFEVSFDELSISGLSVGAGQQVSTLTLRDVDIGVGLSRPAYLRLLIKSLTRLRDGMADGPDKVEVQRRIKEAQDELDGTEKKPGLEAAEEELEKLERKDRWIAGSLSPDERKRLAELSELVRRDTGIVADVGGIEVGPLSGKIVAAGAKVGAIHLEGRIPLNTAGYLADEDLAERFARGGAKAQTVAELAKGSEVHLTIASAELTKGPGNEPVLRVLADRVPTEAELVERLARMPAGADASVRARVEQARDTAHELALLQAKSPKSPADQDQITAQTNRLRELVGLEVGSVTLGPIIGGLDPERGSFKATLTNVDAQDIAGDGFAVKRVQGEIGLGIGGFGGLAKDYRDVTKDDAKKALSGQLDLDVTAESIRTETTKVGEVSISGLKAEVGLLDDGYRISNLRATRIGIRDVDFGDGATHVTAVGAVIEGLGIDAEIHLRTVGDDTELASATMSRLDIDRLSADTIVYDAAKTSDGATLHAELKSGALRGIRARNLTVAQEADGSKHLSGRASVAGVNDLHYRVVMGALNSKTHTPETTTVKGVLQGGTMPEVGAKPKEAAGAAKGPEPVIDAEFASGKDGTSYSLALKALHALGTEITTPDGSVVIRHVAVSGHVKGTDAGLAAGAELTNIDVSRVDWRAGTATIKSDRSITIKKATVAARLLAPDPMSDDPQRRSGGLWIDDFDVHHLDASSLTYTDPPIDVHLSRYDDPHPGALHARRIRLQRFFMPYTRDEKTQQRVLGKATAGTLTAEDVHVDFRGMVAEKIGVKGGLDAKAITVDIFEKDKLVVRARGVGGDLDLDLDGKKAHAVLTGFDTGVVTITPEAILIGGPGQRGMHFDQLRLDVLDVSNTEPPRRLELHLEDAGGIEFFDVDVTARIERWLPGEEHPADQPFRRIVVNRFEIARIEAEGLWLELPDDGVVVRIPMADEYKGSGPLPKRATLTRVVLASEKEGRSFEWVPGAAGFAKGKVTVGEISVPKLTAEVAGKFKGTLDLHTDAASIGFAKNGDTTVDIANPRARMKEEASLDYWWRKLIVEEIGASKVSVALKRGRPAKVTITDAYADKLRFSQEGVVIKTGRITLPGEVTASPTGGTIPELKIEDASIHIDFTRLLGSSGAGPGFPLDEDSITRLMDSLQGDLSFDVYLVKAGILTYDPQDLLIPVQLHFTDGKIDYKALQTSLQGKIKAKTAAEKDSPSGFLGGLTRRPEFWMEGSDLVFGLHVADLRGPVTPIGGRVVQPTIPIRPELFRWNLATAEVKPAKDLHQLRLARLIEPVPEPAPEGEAEQAVKQQETEDLLKSIELQNVKANLELKSKDKIPLALTKGPVTGTVTLAPDALIGLKARGNLPPGKRPVARAKPSGARGLAIDAVTAVNFESVNLVIGGTTQVTTGDIKIEKLTNGFFDMDALYPPHPLTLDAKIASAVAHNIHWDLAYKPF